jgi:hypothetical protein
MKSKTTRKKPDFSKLAPETIAVRAGTRRTSEYQEHSEALFLTSSFCFDSAELAEETPDTLTALYEFDKFNLVWDSAMGIDNGSYNRNHGIAFIGNNGTLILDRQGWEVIEERQAKNKVVKPLEKVQDSGVELHWENFIAAIRNNNPSSLRCSIEEGAHIATVAQMGNIAYRSGKKISWNVTITTF